MLFLKSKKSRHCDLWKKTSRTMSKYTKKFKYKKDKEAEQTIQISKPLHRPGNNLTKPLFVTQLRPII